MRKVQDVIVIYLQLREQRGLITISGEDLFVVLGIRWDSLCRSNYILFFFLIGVCLATKVFTMGLFLEQDFDYYYYEHDLLILCMVGMIQPNKA